MRHGLIQCAAVLLLGAPGQLGPPATTDLPIPAQNLACIAPAALVASPDGASLFIGGTAPPCIAFYDIAANRLTRTIPMPDPPLGLALSSDGTRLYVTCAAPSSQVCLIDVPQGRIVHQFPAGHTAMSPLLSPDEQTLYLCNRFNDDISFIALPTGAELRRVKVQREPIAAALTPNGKSLLVANHLPAGRADRDVAAAVISVIDTASGELTREIPLSNGSGLLRDLRISPDGRYACITHIRARFHYVPRTVHLGWINQNAISLIDLSSLSLLATVTLDETERGAANPWAAAWTSDGKFLCVTHAGTHELSVIDAPALLDKLHRLPATIEPPSNSRHYERFAFYQRPHKGPARSRAEAANDFRFLDGLRRRITLDHRGPRALALIGHSAWIANYFSDTLTTVHLSAPTPLLSSIPLAPPQPWSAVRQGEMWFNDATRCVQGWQSCASCHDADARADGLNWDLLNDGDYNPKNTKSLLFAHRTPPAMSLGVRKTAQTAVRAGLRHILFTDALPEISVTIDAWLQSLQPLPSPRLLNSRLSPAAQRGRRIFMDPNVGCANCHPPPLFTDLQAYQVGTTGPYDKSTDHFDTPALLELWRTAPYLHDGSAPTLRDVLTTQNPNDLHGRTSPLTPAQLADLLAYLASL